MKKVSGGEIFLERVLNEIDKNFNFFIALPEGQFAQRSRENGFKIFINKEVGRLNRDTGSTNYIRYIASLSSWLRETSREVKLQKPDFIVAGSAGMALHAFALSRITRKKFMWMHLHPIMQPGSGSALVLRFLSRYAAAVTCCSQAVKDSLIACGLDADKLFVAYAGVNTDDFNEQASLLRYLTPENSLFNLGKLYSLSGEKIRICLISTIIPWKGHKYLIEAIHRLPAALLNMITVDMVGSIIIETPLVLQYKNEVLDLINRYGLNETISFGAFKKDLKEYYHTVDILLNCSQEPEPMGNTIAEAMALSKIVIVTDQGGPLELVNDTKNGFVSDHKNPQSLADKISLVCCELQIAQLVTIQQEARLKAVANLDIRDATRVLEEIFKRV